LSLLVAAVAFSTTTPSNAQKFYWHHFEAGGSSKIKRANLDGTQVEELFDLGGQTVYGLALDRPGGKIYWTEDGPVRRANLDGSNAETVLDLVTPNSVAVDEVNRRLYVSGGFDFGHFIGRSDMDGLNYQEIIWPGDGDFSAESIQIDSSGGKVYYIVLQGYIYRANLDGSQNEVLIPEAGEHFTFGLALDRLQGKLYWSDFNGDRLRRANLDGTNIESLLIPVSRPIDIGVEPCGQRIFWNEPDGSAHRAKYDALQSQTIMPSGVGEFAIENLVDEPGGLAKCIPALSPLGVVVLGAALACAAIMIVRWRRQEGVHGKRRRKLVS
jgi:DNA-binding beta-propeller fold protein YncE